MCYNLFDKKEIGMIQVKKRFDDFRLYDTKNGKYVEFNAENRSRALFCMIVNNEAQKEGNRDTLYSVEEMANLYGKTLYEFREIKKANQIDYEAFMYLLDRRFGLHKLDGNRFFEKLALCVLYDQQDEYTQTNIYDVETLKRDYGYMDNEIFNEEKELKL